MKSLSNRFIRRLFAVSILAACGAFSASAQISKTNEETEVPIIKQFRSPSFRCIRTENAVIDEETFKKIIADKECTSNEPFKVDFAGQTLIGYHVHGDCFVSATARVFRRESEKKYQVRVKKIWGGCRAAGSYQSWLVIEKIPAGYAVEFTETTVDRLGKSDEENVSVDDLKTPPKSLETREIDLKGCLPIYRQSQLVIKDNETYLKAMHDTDRKRCLKEVEKIDFKRHALLGIEINSGYCGYPLGLRYETVKDVEKRQYVVNISYLDPRGSVCRAYSQYDLWLLVPKLPDGYEVKFEVMGKPAKNRAN
jgi:hypothetical protein